MNNQASNKTTPASEQPPRAAIWDLLLAEDDTELDPERIAAYVEGRLDPQQHEKVRQLVARSPRAMDMVDTLYEFLEESEAESSSPAADIRPAGRGAASGAEDSRSPTLLLALAASLLVAAVAGYSALERTRTASGLRNQVALLDQKLKVAPHTPALLAESEPATVLHALGERTRSRGPDEPSAEEIEARSASLREAFDSIDQLIRDQGESAELLNLRAAAALGIANTLPAGDPQSDSDPKDSGKGVYWRTRAEQDLARATRLDPRFAPAWFNLAVILEGANRLDEAQKAWDAYLAAETRKDLQQAVRQHLGRTE